MHYFIDGYNLLFRLRPDIAELQDEREKIIHDLNDKAGLLQLDFSVVFDAPTQSGYGSRTHFNHIEILYTQEGETADEFILDKIRNSKNPTLETIITSDKNLASRARRKSAHAETVENFTVWLERAYKNKRKKVIKEKKKPSPTSVNKKEEKSKEQIHSPPTPKPKMVLEECVDYYEQIFESRFQALCEDKPNRKKDSPKKKKLKKRSLFEESKSNKYDEHSEMERWQKLFEEKLEKP